MMAWHFKMIGLCAFSSVSVCSGGNASNNLEQLSWVVSMGICPFRQSLACITIAAPMNPESIIAGMLGFSDILSVFNGVY